MKRTIVLLSTMALTLLVASGVALATAIGSVAGGKPKVVGPGESIQKAVYAAHPGDTIVVKGGPPRGRDHPQGWHKAAGTGRRDRGSPPESKADSICSKVFWTGGLSASSEA